MSMGSRIEVGQDGATAADRVSRSQLRDRMVDAGAVVGDLGGQRYLVVPDDIALAAKTTDQRPFYASRVSPKPPLGTPLLDNWMILIFGLPRAPGDAAARERTGACPRSLPYGGFHTRLRPASKTFRATAHGSCRRYWPLRLPSPEPAATAYRAIDAGHASDDEPYMELRDTAKTDPHADADL
jgi:hypothetical protein